MKHVRTPLVVGTVAFVVATTLAALGADLRRGDQDRDLERNARPKEALHEHSPGGSSEALSAAEEQVSNRAYPRGYVETQRALVANQAFQAAPDRLSIQDFSPDKAQAAATRGSVGGSWTELGPFTPQVPAVVTYSGGGTLNSGRVTALALDPRCGTGTGCRLWVGAAGGGVWATDDALAPKPSWRPLPDGISSTAIGSLAIDPSDPSGDTIYAGTGEPNGSTDSEAGVGLFKSTDGGTHWHLVDGSYAVAHDRSVGAIAVDPTDPNHIYVGTDLARHGHASTYGGRRTPPGAPTLGLYESTDGGNSFSLAFSMPGSSVDPATGFDYFQGGVHEIVLDPSDPSTVYVGTFGYGISRRSPGVDGDQQFHQVFLTRNPKDRFGDRTAFAVTRADGHTRIYAGDSSDDQGRADLWRTDRADRPASALVSGGTNQGAWRKLSSPVNGTPGFTSFDYCGAQCGYDDPVSVDPTNPDVVWLGGQMAYGEIPGAEGGLPISNGRTVVRSTDGGVTFTDMTVDAQSSVGMHPDHHAIALDGAGRAFLGSDGGVARVANAFVDRSADCDTRGLTGADLVDCRRFLSAVPRKIDEINDGLRTIQFQGLAVGPSSTGPDIIGGTQDNGTWAYTGTPTWVESIGGDGGPAAIDPATGVRMHSYTGTTGDVNFHGDDPKTWDYDTQPMDYSPELSGFYAPLIADPLRSGTFFAGMQHVWRTTDNGGNARQLDAHCRDDNPLANLPLGDRTITCGDWVPIGADLTSPTFGDRAGQYVVNLARAPGDQAVLWAATRTGRLFVSSNANASDPAKVRFKRIDTSATPGRFISGIAVDPADPLHAWVSYSGYSAYTPAIPGHVFEVRVTPAGTATFADRSFNVGDQPVTDVVADPVTGDLYAATDFGVLRLAADAHRWHRVGTGMPPVAVYDLVLDAPSHSLYAGTHGRGAFQLLLQR